ncbi:NAD(P)-dependent dehydrogenase, short-chain alcohol dehydrogenase family [Chitinophaga eiseniae]|uniref:NAD(P)-dependent dehydrogenase, short-chain alcohol dehydrogenase family n=1 Tax=Chitinophaga eiseniae TaxID=634771 RepID=A0A1T4M7X9_9BACT|nr:SDR family oxidoreductase [Chitinophaga eiseniae]SJZ63021.1 NAD(P)-dependent dehydrogenase, short-chain alcohol dehydrogenase family [Chitinophaga eiseniae]
MASFENSRVIIAGGSSGIGLATAALLIAENARVTITGRSEERLQEAARSVPAATAVLDSNDRSALDRFFAALGSIDHLVIALSGAKGAGMFRDLPLDDLRAGFEGKFWPQLQTLQAALPYMHAGGSITLITAISAIAKNPGTAGLAAINGGLEAMVPGLAKELQPLRINAVSPGVVDTPWWNFLPADVKADTFSTYAGQLPTGKIATAADIAEAVLFLMRNSNTTGTILRCDGGFSL